MTDRLRTLSSALTTAGIAHRQLRSIKSRPRELLEDRGIVTVHRRFFGDLGAQRLAASIGWTLPQEWAEFAESLTGSGSVNYIHLGFERVAEREIRKIYFEFDSDASGPAAPVGALPTNIVQLAVKWPRDDIDHASATYYTRRENAITANVSDLIAERAEDEWTTSIRQAIDLLLGPSDTLLSDVLEVQQVDSPRFSLDVRVPRGRSSHGIERLAVGSESKGRPFATFYFDGPLPAIIDELRQNQSAP